MVYTIDKFINSDKEKFYEIEPYKIYGHSGLRSDNTFFNNGNRNKIIIQNQEK